MPVHPPVAVDSRVPLTEPCRVIHLQALRREFGEVVAVAGLDVTIPRGEIYGLIGPNGAGKTTTIRMGCGLLAPTAGRVLVGGVDVHREPERAQAFLGYLSDSFALYDDLLVWEYLDYFARAYRLPDAAARRRIDEVIASAGLEGKRNDLIRVLSRGMRQRLGLARAIIHRPQALLLDEPASGLDPKARLDLRILLRQLADEGTTIVISSHILTELEGFCTSIGLMERGRLVRSGTIEQIAGTGLAARAVRVVWVGGAAERVGAVLATNPAASGLLVTGSHGVFKFSGSDEDLAAVLAALVTAGVRVVAFAETRETIEDLYMRLSDHKVT